MIFAVHRTSQHYDDSTDPEWFDEYVPAPCPGATIGSRESPYAINGRYKVWEIEIGALDDLLRLSRTNGGRLIVHSDGDELLLEIYDSYRE